MESLLLEGLSVGGTVLAFRQCVRAWQARHWPIAPGTVLSASHDQLWDTILIRITISYEYEVRGAIHHGHRLRFGPNADAYYRQRTVDKILARYHPGARVAVRYHPRNPRLCVLETTIDWPGLLFVLLLTLLVFVFAT